MTAEKWTLNTEVNKRKLIKLIQSSTLYRESLYCFIMSCMSSVQVTTVSPLWIVTCSPEERIRYHFLHRYLLSHYFGEGSAKGLLHVAHHVLTRSSSGGTTSAQPHKPENDGIKPCRFFDVSASEHEGTRKRDSLVMFRTMLVTWKYHSSCGCVHQRTVYIYVLNRRERQHESWSLQDSRWFSAYPISTPCILSDHCLTMLLCFEDVFSKIHFLFNLPIRIHPSSSRTLRCGLSGDRRGSESRPLITAGPPAASERLIYKIKREGKKCVKRLPAMSLLYYNPWAERLCFESGHGVGCLCY